MDSLKESVALHLLRFLLYANGFNPAYEACKKKKNWKFSAKLPVSHLKYLKDGESCICGFGYRGLSRNKEGRSEHHLLTWCLLILIFVSRECLTAHIIKATWYVREVYRLELYNVKSQMSTGYNKAIVTDKTIIIIY